MSTPVTNQGEPPAAATPELELYTTMALIRAFETRVTELYRDGDIPGFVHVSLGQEAVAAGVGAALEPDDYLATTHRGHGHCLAKGVGVDGMMAELFARADGVCRGKGGSMHVSDPSLGVLGANGIVGAGMPLAVGAGLSSKLLQQGRVAVAFFGEGAANQGMFHEALNLAAIWDLPVVFVCENNIYSEFSDSRRQARIPSVAERAKAYGIPSQVVDGNDVEAVLAAASDAAATCRAGKGPVLLECETYRWHGHYEGDDQPYKPEDEVAAWRARDPLLVHGEKLVAAGVATQEQLDGLLAAARERVEAAVEAARSAPVPGPEELFQHVFAS